jgi:hypothetical protein
MKRQAVWKGVGADRDIVVIVKVCATRQIDGIEGGELRRLRQIGGGILHQFHEVGRTYRLIRISTLDVRGYHIGDAVVSRGVGYGREISDPRPAALCDVAFLRQDHTVALVDEVGLNRTHIAGSVVAQ